MSDWTAWAGFVGSWLLVAGPSYQAALELQGEAEEVGNLRAAFHQGTARPEPVSRWWWLLPPVHAVLHRRRKNAFKRAVMAGLRRDQLATLSRFADRAWAWTLVAAGAVLLALKETVTLGHDHRWSSAVTALVVIAMVLACGAHVVVRTRSSARQIDAEPSPPPTSSD